VKYISSLSGGKASAIATERAIQKYGINNVELWFADTLWEDDDLHRFLNDLEKRWGKKRIRHTEGRKPLEVAEDQNIIPNSRIAPCSRELKIKPFIKFLTSFPKPVTVLLGMDYTEMHRMAAPKANYEKIEGVYVDYPLMWKPYEFKPYEEIIKYEWGIEIPRLYNMGFPHNNCGGRCIRQGIKEWQRLRVHFPERFEDVKNWELEQRAKGGARANYSISKDQSTKPSTPLTLAEIEKRDYKLEDSGQEDMFACFCSY